MSTLQLDQAKLQDIAHKMSEFLIEKGAKDAGYNRCLQGLSQALFNKPYEAAIKIDLLESGNHQSTDYDHCDVVILHYTDRPSLITYKGQFHTSAAYSTHHRYSDDEMISIAKKLSEANQTNFRHVNLPSALSAEAVGRDFDVIWLARALGIFDHKETLFEKLSGEYDAILINKNACPHGLDGDLESQLQDALAEGDSVYDTCIWHAEFNDATSSAGFEYFFTLGEIGTAKAGLQPNSWIVSYDKKEHVTIQVI